MSTVIGGVIFNNTPQHLYKEIFDGVDIEYLAHICDCPNEYHDYCWERPDNETNLIGFIECSHDDPEAWFGRKGEYGSFGYKPNPDAEYSAIVGETYTQVVRSKYTTKVQLCSPCYPNQGDLDSPDENGRKTYCLPPDVMGEYN